ncbi:MAG: hypothetical protein EBR30_06135 [Cytophagia bacterium]|jgi:hypothetical protein|nr:hypothetical protein [Cytophagia bacterium]
MASYFRQVPNFDYVSRNPGEKYISEYIPVKNLFKRGKLREDIFGNLQFFEKYQIIGDERPDNVAAKFYDDETLDWIVLLSNNILNIQSEWPMSQRTFDKVMLDRYGSYDNLYNGAHHYETEEIKNSLGIMVLNGGIHISPSWKTNGNFIETINSKITAISATPDGGITPSKTVGVFMLDNIPANVGDQVLIEGVSEIEYNGKHVITSISDRYFTYELPEIPNIIIPTMSTSGQEQVIYTIVENSENSSPTNPRYYEYWDAGLGYSILVPATSFVRVVTNYEYELNIEEEKRNIYVLKQRYLNVVFNDMDDIMPYKKGSQQYVTENLKKGDNIRLYE